MGHFRDCIYNLLEQMKTLTILRCTLCAQKILSEINIFLYLFQLLRCTDSIDMRYNFFCTYYIQSEISILKQWPT